MTLNEILAPVLSKGKFWTDTLSWVDGCTPCSPGCAHCWLAGMEYRFHRPGTTRDRGLVCTSGAFNGRIVERTDRLGIPLHKRKPQVFAIWSDLFHESVSRDFQDRAFATMAIAPEHYFIIVTKRPHVAARYIDNITTNKRVATLAGYSVEPSLETRWSRWPLKNVVILVTMEDQQRADNRIPYAAQLADQGWNVGLLLEPLLAPISLRWLAAFPKNTPTTAQCPSGVTDHLDGLRRFSWIITGPENNPGKRPFSPAWAKDLRDQVQEADVPFFFKAGALDGREWNGVPEI